MRENLSAEAKSRDQLLGSQIKKGVSSTQAEIIFGLDVLHKMPKSQKNYTEGPAGCETRLT